LLLTLLLPFEGAIGGRICVGAGVGNGGVGKGIGAGALTFPSVVLWKPPPPKNFSWSLARSFFCLKILLESGTVDVFVATDIAAGTLDDKLLTLTFSSVVFPCPGVARGSGISIILCLLQSPFLFISVIFSLSLQDVSLRRLIILHAVRTMLLMLK